jgi:signal transduction histidine kinase
MRRLAARAGALARTALLLAAAALVPLRAPAAGPLPSPDAPAVLLLFQDPPEVPLTLAVGEAIRLQLRQRSELVIYSEHLDLSRFAEPGFEEGLRAWVHAKYEHVRLGAVVAVAAGAVHFATRPGPLWPGVPLVFCAVDETRAAEVRGLPGVTGILQVTPIRETLELAVRLLPEARRVVLVGGASESDRAWEVQIRRAAASLPGAPEVVELFGLTVDELKARLKTIPRATPVVGVSFLRDGAGRPWSGPEIVRAIEAEAPGPVLGITDFNVGRGLAGGDVLDYRAMGEATGRLALRVLDGERAEDIPVERETSHRVVLDWRILERWRVPDSRIPAGAEVRFRQLPLFAAYPRTTAAATGALLLQAALLVGFLLERRRRRQAEEATRQQLGRLAHLNRVSTAGELATALAHEINTPLASIQNSARAVRRLLSSGVAPADAGIQSSLALIEGEGRRAAEVIRRLRAVVRREEVGMGTVDAAEVVREAVALVGPQARQRGVELHAQVAPGLSPVTGDRIQLLQVVINLLMNAIQAVAGLSPERRRVTASAAPAGDGVRLSVADEGDGFSPEARAKRFEPFVTSRPEGLGVGLAISRSIVERHGGRLWLDEAPGGACLHVDLPIPPATDRRGAASAPTPGEVA